MLINQWKTNVLKETRGIVKDRDILRKCSRKFYNIFKPETQKSGRENFLKDFPALPGGHTTLYITGAGKLFPRVQPDTFLVKIDNPPIQTSQFPVKMTSSRAKIEHPPGQN